MKRVLYRCLGDEKRKDDLLSEVGHLTKLLALLFLVRLFWQKSPPNAKGPKKLLLFWRHKADLFDFSKICLYFKLWVV